MIEVRIESVRVSLMSPNQVVILKEVDGERRLPIFIGKTEGDAITFHLNGDIAPRPLTHDLAANLLASLEAEVVHVVINDLRNQHFHAAVVVKVEEAEVSLDARPSDAIAIAVRAGCPIFAEDHVLREAGVRPERDAAARPEDLGAFDDFISSLDMSDLDEDT